MNRCARIALAAVLAVCGIAGARAAQSGDAGRIVAYLLELARNQQFLEQQIASETAGEPVLEALTREAMKGYRYEDLGRRLAPVLQGRLSDAQAGQCMAFIGSPTGRAALAAMHAAQGDTQKLMVRLSAPDRDRTLAFLDSSCVKTVVAAMASPEGQDVLNDYGRHLVCDHIARTAPGALPTMHAQGACRAFR
jgi:hypothetical protein